MNEDRVRPTPVTLCLLMIALLLGLDGAPYDGVAVAGGAAFFELWLGQG